MTREVIHTDDAPAAIGPYSQAIKAAGTMLFMSGQIPLRADGSLLEGNVQAQTEQVFANMKAVLKAAGADLSHVVKTTVFLSSMDHFVPVNEVYGKHFPENPPARSAFAVQTLPKNVDVEIEAIAVLP